MPRDIPRVIQDSLALRTRELTRKIRMKKKEIIEYGNTMVGITSVFSSAFLSVFLAFAIDQPTEILWILLFVTVSAIFIMIVYCLDVYLSKKPMKF